LKYANLFGKLCKKGRCLFVPVTDLVYSYSNVDFPASLILKWNMSLVTWSFYLYHASDRGA